jgi:hypothetical protein
VSSPSTSPRDTDQLALAQRRGADEMRAHVRHLVEDLRRVVRLGEQQIEVVEVAALLDRLGDPE